MGITAAIVIAIILALILLSVIWMVSSDRKRKTEKSFIASELGFYPMETPEDHFFRKVVHLHQKQAHQCLELRNLYQKKEADATFYLFDLIESSGDSSDLMAEGVIAVNSPLLNLPRFSIFPKIDMEGKFAELANRFLTWAVEQSSNRIVFETDPHFERRYMVCGEDERAVKQFLSDYHLSRLSRGEYWQIEAEGDMFTLSKVEFTSRENNKVADLSERLREARMIFDLFRQSRSSLG